MIQNDLPSTCCRFSTKHDRQCGYVGREILSHGHSMSNAVKMPLFDSDFRLIPCFSRGHVNVTASSDRHLDRFHAGSQTAGFHERDVIC